VTFSANFQTNPVIQTVSCKMGNASLSWG